MLKIKGESQIKYGERLGDASSIINSLDSKKFTVEKIKLYLVFFSYPFMGHSDERECKVYKSGNGNAKIQISL